MKIPLKTVTPVAKPPANPAKVSISRKKLPGHCPHCGNRLLPGLKLCVKRTVYMQRRKLRQTDTLRGRPRIAYEVSAFLVLTPDQWAGVCVPLSDGSEAQVKQVTAKGWVNYSRSRPGKDVLTSEITSIGKFTNLVKGES